MIMCNENDIEYKILQYAEANQLQCAEATQLQCAEANHSIK